MAKIKHNLTPEQRANWLSALRSGDFKQTEGCFARSDGTFCVLGVLCKINGVKMEFSTYNTYGGKMLDTHASWDFIRDKLPDVFESIYNRNDSEHLSFTQMADWLDEVLA